MAIYTTDFLIMLINIITALCEIKYYQNIVKEIFISLCIFEKLIKQRSNQYDIYNKDDPVKKFRWKKNTIFIL